MASSGSGEHAGRLALLVGIGGLGGTGVTAWFHPIVGGVILGSGIVLIGVITLTALFGKDTWSARAFRLLRLFNDKQEPPAPEVEARSRLLTEKTAPTGHGLARPASAP
jgi:hypothetical protein